MSHYDVIIIGAGAAGLMCALTAGKRHRRVAILEHNNRVGKKIAISGGGRCNFTNVYAGPDNYLSGHPDFCRSALARYTPWDFIALVEKHGIAYHEKKLGQQFCDVSSRMIIEMLMNECNAAGVTVHCNCRVQEVQKTTAFRLTTSQGEFSCDSLVIATGGLSFPNLGATDFGYRLASQFGIRVTPLRPGLVPLTLHPQEGIRFQDLSGISLPVHSSLPGISFEEALLFTHRGVSGPAILQISSYWRGTDTIMLDLLPGQTDPNFLVTSKNISTTMPVFLSQYWPRRFADAWCECHKMNNPLRSYKDRELLEMTHLLHRWPLQCHDTEGYPKAEVTVGGIDTGELSSKTMESRRVRGLFFIGEVVDVTGWLGGYNFQWAWASGYATGSVV